MTNNRSLTNIITGLLRSNVGLLRLLRAAVFPPLLLALFSLSSLLSCERRPLEVYYEPTALVRVELDWLDQFRQKPNGMLMLIYDENDSIYRAVGPTSEVEAQTLHLGVGTYKFIFVSYPDMETIYFPRLGNHLYANARSVQIQGHTYAYWELDREKEAPEDIGVAVDTITITQEMVSQDIKFVDYRDRDKYSSDTLKYVFHEVPDPMTVTLYICAKVKRIQSIKTIDATISGMADGFYLSQINRTTERATLFIPEENWRHNELFGEKADSMGYIRAQIASFGLPYGKELLAERDSTDNVLSFHIVLTNDSVQDVSFNVGKDIRYLDLKGNEARIRQRQDLHDLKIELDLSEVIVMPPTPPTRGNGQGFNAVVDDWDDGGTFNMGGF